MKLAQPAEPTFSIPTLLMGAVRVIDGGRAGDAGIYLHTKKEEFVLLVVCCLLRYLHLRYKAIKSNPKFKKSISLN